MTNENHETLGNVYGRKHNKTQQQQTYTKKKKR